MKKVYAFLATGFEETEAICTIDILRRAGMDVVITSIYNEKTVVGAHNISIIADKTIDEINPNDADLLFLPGGIPGTPNLESCEKLMQILDNHIKQNKFVATICAAPTILGKRGFLDNKNAACYPGCENDMGKALCKNSPAIIDGLFITGRGMGVTTDFALLIVKTLIGESLANELFQNCICK